MQVIKEILKLTICLLAVGKLVKSQEQCATLCPCSTEVCYYKNKFFSYSQTEYGIIQSFCQQNLSDLIMIQGRTYNKNDQWIQAIKGICGQFDTNGQSVIESSALGAQATGLGIFGLLQQNQPNTYQNNQTIVYGQSRQQYGYSPLRVYGQKPGSPSTSLSLSPLFSPQPSPPSLSPLPSPQSSPSSSPSPSPQQFGLRRPEVLPTTPPPPVTETAVSTGPLLGSSRPFPPPQVAGQEITFGTIRPPPSQVGETTFGTIRPPPSQVGETTFGTIRPPPSQVAGQEIIFGTRRPLPPPQPDNTIATGLDLQFQNGNEDQVRNLGIKFPPVATSYNFSENTPQVQQIIQAVNSSYQEMSNNLTRTVNNTYQQLNNTNLKKE